MEIMTRDEFWARNPAPDTKFFELHNISRVSAHPIEVKDQDPDDIVAVTYSVEDDEPADSIAVVEWGSWSNHSDLIEQHNEAVRLMKTEDGIDHVCEIGLS